VKKILRLEFGIRKIKDQTRNLQRVTRNSQPTNEHAIMQKIDRMMRQAISDNIFPGAVLLVSREDSILFFDSYGHANLFSGVKMTRDTIFDLASLTKPLATAMAVMRLVEDGNIHLEQQLGHILSEFIPTDKARIQLKHLLYHNAGLPDYRPYYTSLSNFPAQERVAALRELLVAEPLIHPIGKTVLYSDVGFMILRWVIEQKSGWRLDQFVTETIYNKIAQKDLFFIALDSPQPRHRFAATEKCSWRHTVLEGQVHDENAYAVGGIEGHAGLFGSAAGVHLLLVKLLTSYDNNGPGNLFDKDLVRFFFRRLPDTDKALGFDMPSKQNSSSGKFFSPKSVGHLGFTGTSFWMDLTRKIIIICLTNRVHPSRQNNTIKAFRPKLHDAVMEYLV
jgi:CubicO group peptidase (beta-lactamase class C family)